MTNIEISNEEEYLQALTYLEPFFDLSPEMGTTESEEMMAMIEAAVRYEEEHYPVEAPVPEVLLAFRREQMGLTGCPLMGIDLAWKGKNCTGIAVGEVVNGHLLVVELSSAPMSLEQVIRQVGRWQPEGIAIDAPLVIPNQIGQRDCEQQIGRQYGNKGASCHTSNLDLYPNALSVQLSQQLASDGFAHRRGGRWQIECYPHPALIEIFDLDYRLAYKKGLVDDKRTGQIQLAQRLLSLTNHPQLPMHIPSSCAHWLQPEIIKNLKGAALKQNEDRLDALVCLYIAFRYHQGRSLMFGTEEQGYIVI